MKRLALTLAVVAALGSSPAPASAVEHKVTFDQYSVMLDGRREFLWSGEFHPFRLPSPDLWRDVLQKMKASGYNAVSVYFDWNYHSPHPASTTSPVSGTWTGCWTWRPRPGCT
ncbi:hypothetical protein GCM10029964_066780 [Kibdelosporangium lantanae]